MRHLVCGGGEHTWQTNKQTNTHNQSEESGTSGAEHRCIKTGDRGEWLFIQSLYNKNMQTYSAYLAKVFNTSNYFQQTWFVSVC